MTTAQIKEYFPNSVPRVHGNGFIQVDLEPGQRLHVWGHPAIPRQQTYTGIHDHSFGFESRVIRGRVFQIPYVIDGCGRDYMIYAPVPKEGEDTQLNPTGIHCRLSYGPIQIIQAGQYYLMSPGDIHETVADMPAASIMTKTERSESAARVYVPMGSKPDNVFSRYWAPNMLWQIIKDVIG